MLDDNFHFILSFLMAALCFVLHPFISAFNYACDRFTGSGYTTPFTSRLDNAALTQNRMVGACGGATNHTLQERTPDYEHHPVRLDQRPMKLVPYRFRLNFEHTPSDEDERCGGRAQLMRASEDALGGTMLMSSNSLPENRLREPLDCMDSEGAGRGRIGVDFDNSATSSSLDGTTLTGKSKSRMDESR